MEVLVVTQPEDAQRPGANTIQASRRVVVRTIVATPRWFAAARRTGRVLQVFDIEIDPARSEARSEELGLVAIRDAVEKIARVVRIDEVCRQEEREPVAEHLVELE